MPSTSADTDPSDARESIAKLVERVRTVHAAQLPPPAERKAIRKAARISGREAAAAIGVAPMTFWHWERGDTEPSPANVLLYRQLLDELADALGAES